MINKSVTYYLFLLLIAVAQFSCKSKKGAVSPSSANSNTTTSVKTSKLSEKQQIEIAQNYINASKEKMLGNIDKAAILYAQCIKADPTNAAALYELAGIYNFKRDVRNATVLAREAFKLDSKNEWYGLLLAECYTKERKYSDAIKVYLTLLKSYPERLDFYESLASLQLLSGKVDDAMKTYEKLELMLGVNESISMQKLNLYKQLKQNDKIIEELNKLIATFPNEPKYLGMLGETYMEKGMKEKALESYLQVLKLDSTYGLVHLSLSDYYKTIKDEQKSFDELKLAFKSEYIDIDNKIQLLLRFYYTSKDTDSVERTKNLELCKILTELYPKDAKAHSVNGDFLNKYKQSKDARNAYRKAVELDKEKFVLWSQLLILNSELNDFDAMYKESTEAMELFPNQPLPYLLKGIAAMQLGKSQEAVDVLKQGVTYVVDNKPMLGQFYSSLGDAYNKVPDHKLSDEAYEKALSVDSNNVFVLNNYAYYLSLRNQDLERAEQMSKRSNELAPNNDSYLDTYGWILYQMKKYSDAQIWIEKAIQNGGANNSVILEHYGDILYQLGKKDEALKYWKMAKDKGQGSDFLNKKVVDQKLYE
ncbi:MAG: tetratricopeptide repeat protein [Bacteroidetes bacterium]|nr:tetratricopeptide repeat protein [Bacteroidota bacterium]